MNINDKEKILNIFGVISVFSMILSLVFHFQEVFFWSSGLFPISIHFSIILIIIWIGIYLILLRDNIKNKQ